MASGIGNLFGAVLLLVFAVVIITQVLIPTFLNANQTGWSTAMIAVWALGGLICVFGAVILAGRALGIV